MFASPNEGRHHQPSRYIIYILHVRSLHSNVFRFLLFFFLIFLFLFFFLFFLYINAPKLPRSLKLVDRQIMAFKRKRSSSSVSPASIPPSISSPTSPVIYTGFSPSPSPSPFPQSHNHDVAMSNRYPSNCPSLYEDSRLRLHSRTRKRVRNKPDELSIHGNSRQLSFGSNGSS